MRHVEALQRIPYETARGLQLLSYLPGVADRTLMLAHLDSRPWPDGEKHAWSRRNQEQAPVAYNRMSAAASKRKRKG